jgi:hypothetical protein
MKKFVLPLAVVALVLAFVWVAGAAAQTGTMSTVNGFIWGNSGGSHQEWTVAVPMNTDVTVSVEYNPCAPPNAVALAAYGPEGQVGVSHQTAYCTKTMAWNTGDSTSVTIKLSYYEHGMELYYVMNATGIDLNAGQAPMAAEEQAEVTQPVTGTMVVSGTEAAPVVAPAPAPAPITVPADILGTSGGAHMKYDMMLTGGQEYDAVMTYWLDAGGNWPAVGFTVWGPDGVVAQSKSMYGAPAEADFIAPMDGKYTLDVYNYHPGITLYYTLSGVPITAPEPSM